MGYSSLFLCKLVPYSLFLTGGSISSNWFIYGLKNNKIPTAKDRILRNVLEVINGLKSASSSESAQRSESCI
jgi:hypothetical protein